MSQEFLDLLGDVAPWTFFAVLVGAANAAFLFLLIGRSPLRFPLYLLCGVAVALLIQPLSPVLAPGFTPLLVGEVSLPLVSASVWLTLGVARALGL